MEQNKSQSDQPNRDQETEKTQVPASRFGKPQIRQPENQGKREDEQDPERKRA